MSARYVLPLVVIVLGLAAGLSRSPLPAEASFHCIRIESVMGGANGDTNIQYVELRQVGTGQNLLAGGHTKLLFFDAAGNQTAMYTVPADAPSGVNRSILFGTSTFASHSTVAPDYVFPANVMAPSGKVQFVGDFNCNFPSGTIIDSVAYGSYTGTIDCPPPPASPGAAAAALPTSGAQVLTLNNLNPAGTCGNNATEYSIMTATPRNNAGQTGSICIPDPCGGPTPTPTPGDSDGDGVLDATPDNCPNWPNPTQALPPWIVPLSDPDCDGFTTAGETFMGTLTTVQCPATITAGDEIPDPWPMDNNDDRKAALADILAYIPVFGSASPNPPYNSRFDITGEGVIGLADILSFIPFFNITCAPSG